MTTAAAPDIIAQWRELAWKDIIFTLAGPIAELRWQRKSRWAVQWAAREMGERCLGEVLPVAGSDFDQVRRRVQWLCPDQQERIFILAWFETEKEVAQHLASIIALGRFLSEQSDLSDVALLEFWSSHTAAQSTARCKRLSLSTLIDALNDG